MDQLIVAARCGQNVIVTANHGIERSRFLLRSELILHATIQGSNIKTIYHILDSDRLVQKVYNEAVRMPFSGFKIGVNMNLESDSIKPASLSESAATLTICNLKCVLESFKAGVPSPKAPPNLFVFDGITLESLEGACCDVSPSNTQDRTESLLPSAMFTQLSKWCRSIVLACNPPLDGLEAELDCKFPIVISAMSFKQPCFKVNTSIVPRDTLDKPYKYGGLDHKDDDGHEKERLHVETGKMLESVSKGDKPGGVVVFFPSYGRMVEYHNAWKQMGLFDRLGMPYQRENRGGDHFKNSIVQLVAEKKFLFLCSIRYHKEEDLAEFALAQARVVIVVGLPYPFMNSSWDARILYNNENTGTSNRLSGSDLHKYRAIEFLNGIIKRCLNEFRFRNLSLLLLDGAMEYHRNKLASELGDVSVLSASAYHVQLGFSDK